MQAARLWPEEGHRARLEARLAAWTDANPPFRGPNWACGQEAALRVLHLALALMLAGLRRPGPAARDLLALHARRILATRAYARAQDNNHSISEPAGLLACGWLLGDAAMARRAGQELVAALARLVAPDGGFAQLSTGYHRLLLDVLSVVEALRRHQGAPPLPEPFTARAAAAARWLARLVSAQGALPALGHQDGSALADLSAGGVADARGSVERAMRLFAGDRPASRRSRAAAGWACRKGCRRRCARPNGWPPAAVAGRWRGRAPCCAPARCASAPARPTCCISSCGTATARC
ncbi:alginate lyase family protein [Teichococcus aestuarii]|uniref:alginate lyase family protein n=1 Tax=Teichococcus aestuarii TaxID=568898 RepID=UPI00360E4A55